ncbi:MAG TPA: DegQ family serine endoprotease [Desulfatirhabdiaceae bacterium]|nr:DegQ family serine endoprotease [Desulfatirhabdiaceae bacterium]
MKPKNNIKTILLALILTGIVIGIGTGMTLASNTGELLESVSSGVSAGSQMIPANFSDLADQVRAGVVNIQVSKKVSNAEFPHFRGKPFGDRNPFGDFFGPFGGNRPDRKQQGVGSGFIISADGYILTNNHVVEDADQIRVKLSDGKEMDGRIIGRDPKTDLAIVKIDGATDLHPLKLGDSDTLKVGNWVVAVGSPFGLEQTVTSGIISAKGRVIGSGPYDNFIQTDASINPGNSGGPLINMQAEVVGINTAIVASGQGIGFAIPINMAKEIAPQLQKKGHVTRGLLGVNIQDVTPEMARYFGLKEARGALVAMVVADGPAEKAGILQGDVIVTFNGQPVVESRDLSRIVASTPVGETVTVQVMRDGKAFALQAKVGEMDSDSPTGDSGDSSHKSLGMSVQNLTPQIAGELGLKKNVGVVVTDVEPGSAAAEAMIRKGDVIREVNRKPVMNATDFAEKIKTAKDDESLLLLIERKQNTLFVTITPK